MSISNGKISLLCLLDLSAAFDTVDHDILVQRLEHSYGLKGIALAWLKDYLAGRVQSVIWNRLTSVPRLSLQLRLARARPRPATICHIRSRHWPYHKVIWAGFARLCGRCLSIFLLPPIRG